MKLSFDSLKKIYLGLTLFYYIGFLSFTTRILAGGKGDDAFGANAAGSLPKQAIGILLLVLGVALLLRTHKRLFTAVFIKNYAWCLIIGFFVASIFWSYAPGISLRRVIAFVTLLIAAFCIVEWFDPQSLLEMICKALGLAVIMGFVYAVIDPSSGFGQGAMRDNYFKGIFSDKNGGARCYTYAVLLMVGLGMTKQWWQRAVLGLLCLAIALSQSATAAVMLTAGLTMIFAFNFMRTKHVQTNFNRFFALTMMMIVGCIAISYLYEFILGLLGRDPSLTNRVVIWELLYEYIEEKAVLGYGFGAFWASSAVEGFVERWGYIGNAHSGYYEALLHGGWSALILVFVMLAKTLGDLIRSYISDLRFNFYSALIPIVLLQVVINYVAFVVLNHNSFDMFLFAIISFIASKHSAQPIKASENVVRLQTANGTAES